MVFRGATTEAGTATSYCSGGKDVMAKSHSLFRRILQVTLMGVGFCVFGAVALAASGINRQINYQGRLLTSGGSSVSNGTYLLTLSLYDASSGGNRLWTAAGSTSTPSAINVNVQNGLFSIQLGDTGAGQNPFAFDFNQDSLYLGVTVASDTEMVPRKRLTSVPYAFVAESLQGQFASSSVANTGGNLFALRQGAANAASGDRSALFIQTSGTSNVFDYLIKGNSGSDVFTVSRQGNVTTTGNFMDAGNTILGDSSTDSVIINARVSSDITPTTDATFSLGTPSLRWLNISAVNVSSTNVTTTNLSVNGQTVCLTNGTNCPTTTSTTPTFDQVTTAGNTTTNEIVFGGGTSTGIFETDSFVVAGPGGIGDFGGFPTKLLSSSPNGNYWTQVDQNITANTLHPTSSEQWAHYVTDDGDFQFWAASSSQMFYQLITSSQLAAQGFPQLRGGIYIGGDSTGTPMTLSPFFNNYTTLGDAQFSWEALYVSGTRSFISGFSFNNSTGTNATTTNSFANRLNFTNGTSTGSFSFNSASGSSLFVTGQAVCLANGTNCPASAPSIETDTLLSVTNRGAVATATLTLFGGATISNLTVTGTTSLQSATATNLFATNAFFTNSIGTNATTTNSFATNFGATNATIANLTLTGALSVTNLTWTNATGTNTTSTNVFATNFGATTATISGLSATNATATTQFASSLNFTNGTSTGWLGFNVASGSSLFVQGQAVCLANGTNCPASSGGVPDFWSYDVATDTLYPATSTSDVLIGGATSGTAAFRFLTSNTSSRLYVGAFGSSTNIVLGASTSSISNTAFQLAGGSFFANANIGAASSVYTNAAFIAGSSLYGDGFITKPNGSITVTSSANILFNQNGNVGIHTSAPSAALDVSGNIRNVINTNATFTALGNLSLGSGADPLRVSVAGKYAYVANSSKNTVDVIDVTNPALPFQVGTSSFAGTPTVNDVFATGRYVYAVTAESGSESFAIIDVSNPARPVRVATTTLVQTGTAPQGVYVSGRYAYVVSDIGNTLHIIDIGSSSAAPIVSTTTIPNNPARVVVQGRYAYTLNSGDGALNIIDVGNASSPVIRSTFFPSSLGNSFGLAVSGRYAYTVGYGSDALNVIDISNASAPVQVATSTLDGGGDAWDVVVSGRYAFVSERDSDLIAVVDISIPTAPVRVASIPVTAGSTPVGMTIAGRYLYVTTIGGDRLKIIDIGGTEVAGLIAASADLGSLQVLTNGSVANQFTVGGGLAVGTGGIFSAGSIAVYATSTTSTFSGPVTVQGQLVCLANGTNCPASAPGSEVDTLLSVTNRGAVATSTLTLYGGAIISNLTVTGTTSLQSATATSLFATTFGTTTGTASSFTTTNLVSTNSVLTNVTSTSQFVSNFVSTAATTTNAFVSSLLFTNGTSTGWFGFNTASGTNLIVNGQNVCLQNGTNCPVSGGGGGTNVWSYNGTTDTLYPTTSTSDVLIGGATQGTSAFSFLTSNTSSRLYVGAFGSSTNIVLGGPTSTISNTAFQLDGNDLFVAGNIGSASSVYTNGAFLAGSGTTVFGDGFITKTNGSLSVSSSANVLFNQTGNVGIRNTAPQEALDVTGGIRNVLTQGQAFSVLGRSSVGSDTSLSYPVIVGNYLYAVNRFDSPFPLVVFDVTNAAQPVKVGSASTCLGATFQNNLAVVGSYAYVLCDYDPGPSRMQIFDVSNPVSPSLLSTISLGNSINLTSVAVNGRYAYVTVETDGTLRTVDISDPANPLVVSSTSLPGASSSAYDVKVSGRYAYVVGPNTDKFWVLDLVNPAVPVVVGNLSSVAGAEAPISVVVQGKYAYTMNVTETTLSVIDVSDPANPSYVTTTPLNVNATYLDPTIVGSYLLVTGTGGPQVYDISSSTNPVYIGAVNTSPNDSVTGIALSGKRILVTDESVGQVTVINMPGVDTAGLRAANAELGTLAVLTDGQIGQNLFVGNNIFVGNGGITSRGGVTVLGNSTSTFSGPVTVQGQLVCLANGTNCPVSGGSSAPATWSYSASTDTLYPTTSTSDVLIGGATQGTSAFSFLTSNTSSRLYVGAFGSSTDIVLGGPSSTVSNTAFQLNGGSLFVNNNIGAASSVYTNAAFIAGPGSTMFGDGYINKTNGAFTINSTSGDLNFQTITSGNIVLDPLLNGSGTTTFGGSASDTISFVGRLNSSILPAVDGIYTLGTSTLRWLGVDTMNVTTTNLVTTNLSVNGNISVSTTAPTYITNVSSTNYINVPTDSNVAISGRYAYVASRSTGQGRLSIIDISNPSAPTSVGFLNAEFVSGFSYNNVVVSGKYAYVGGENGVISIVDISNPASPVRTNPAQSNYFAPASTLSMFDLVGSGKYLYAVGNTPSTFNIIDTASSTQTNGTSKNMLSVVATYTSSTAFSTARGLAVQGPNVYVVSNNQLTIMDVSNPATTTVKGMVRDTTNLASARYTAIQGKRLYVAATNRLTIMDVSNVSAPTTVGSFVDSTNLAGANHVAVVGNIAYVTATTNHKVVVLDVSNPAAPTMLGVYTDATNMNSPYGITINGNRAYVAHGSAAGNSGLTVLGISGYEMGGLTAGSIDVTTLRASDNVDIGGTLNVRGGISSDGGGILTTGGLGVLGSATSTINGKLNLLNGTLVDGGSIVHALNTNLFDSFQHVSSGVAFQRTRAAGRYLYALRNSNTFAVYDLSTTSTISQVGAVVSSTALASSPTDFAINGKYAYALAGNRFSVIDVSDPTTPTIISSTSTVGVLANSQKIEVVGRYAFIAHANSGGNANVSVWDVVNPLAPVLVNIISYNGRFGGTTMSLALEGKRLYVGGNSPAVFTIVDISNPLTATTTGSVSASIGPNGIAARGKWVYAQSNGSSFQVIDVSSSTNPTISTCASISSTGNPVVLAGSYALVGTQGGSSDGIAAIDISNPGTNTCAVTFQQSLTPTPTPTYLSLAGRRLFVSTNSGLYVVTMHGLDAPLANLGSIFGDSINLAGQLSVYGQAVFSGGISAASEITGTVLNMRDSGTSTFNGVVSTTQLYVGNQLVCLANGTNCPVSGGSGVTTWSYSAATDSLYPASSTSDVLIGGATQGTSAFSFFTSNTSSRFYVGAFGSSTDIVLGGSTSTISNAAFQLDGNDLFVAGNIGSASSVYTNGAFIAGPGSTMYGDGYIARTTGDLAFSASSGVLRPATNNTLSLGSVTSSFADIYSSGTVQFVNASGSALELNKITNPTVVSSVPISGLVKGTAVSGRYAYIVNGSVTSGLVVVDIADPKYPAVATSVNLGTSLNDIVIQGSYAYVGGSAGFHALDIRNPSSPSSVGFINTGNTVAGIAVAGKYAYVVADTILTVVDISNPTNLKQAASVNVGTTVYSRVAVQGAYLYTVDDTDGIQVFDITDPTHPVLLSSVLGAGDANSGVYVSGKYLYLAAGQEGLQVIDISNPYNAVSKSLTPTSDGTHDITVAGKLAYIADEDFFTVFNIASSTNPTLVASIPLSNSFEVTAAGKYAYVGRIGQWSIVDLQGADIASAHIGSLQSNQLTVLDTLDVGNTVSIRNSLNVGMGGIMSNGEVSAPILNVNKPQLVSSATYTTTTVGGVGLTVSGHYGYAAMGTSGMQIFDLMKPDTISPVGSVSVSSVSQIAVTGRYAYTVHSSGGLYIFDVQNPSSPTTTAHITSGLSSPSAIFVSGKYAYVAVTDGLALVDISNPSSPYVLSTGSASPTGSGLDVYVDKGYAYVGKNTGMTIFDVSNPAAVTSVAAYSSATNVESINVSDGYAYLVKRGGTVEILNVTNPASPTVVGSYSVGAVLGSSAFGGRYLYTYGASLNILDVLNPSAPTSVAQAPVSLTGRDVALNGRYLYTLASTGLQTTITKYDLGGADIGNAMIGSLQAGAANVDTNLVVGNHITAQGGLDVGTGGIMSQGDINTPSITLNSFENATTVSVMAFGGGAGESLDISGRYLYLTTFTGSTYVIDISNPSAPTSVSSISNPVDLDIQVAGRYAYIANSGNGIQVLDVSNPSSPQVAFQGATNTNALFVAGKYLYGVGGPQLTKYDIADPTSPSSVGFAANGSSLDSVYVQGRYAYATDGNLGRLFVYDVSSTTPTSTGSVSLTDPRNVKVYGRYAYVVDGSAGLKIVDIFNPAAPTVIGSISSLGISLEVEVSGRYAYLAENNGHIRIIDVSNPAAPTSVHTFTINHGGIPTCHEMKLVGRYLYAACTGSSDLVVIDLGGITANTAYIASLQTDKLIVNNDADITGTLNIGTGLTVGTGGISSDGGISTQGLFSVVDNGFTSGTAGTFFKSSWASSLGVGTQASLMAYTTGTGGSFQDAPVINSFGTGVQSAAGYFINGFENLAGGSSVGLYALDMTSSTVGGAIHAVRNCGTASNTNIVRFGTNSDVSRFAFRCSGQLFADSGTVGSPADYAEYFPTADTSLTTGEVVVMTSDTASSVKRGTLADREQVVGVISEHPLVLGNAGPDGANENNPYYKIVGLLGQLPVKVSSINGPIMAGDKIMAGEDGYGVKATGVGAVVGQALESLTTATGSIKVYVKPEWSGDGIFDAGHNTTNIASQGTATSSARTFDSFGLTFQGSAWDVASSTAITSSFTFVNDVITATSSVFRLNGTLGNSLLTISDIGDVSVTGDLTVGHRLFLGSKAAGIGSTSTYLFVDDTQAATSSYIATNADGWSTATTYDYAERFPSKEMLEPGDLVVVDPTDVNHVKKTMNATDIVMGIVSTKPGFITGAYATGTFPIALAGRVPTRVSTANGAIAAGDELAPSGEPGVAVKAIGAGPTIGIALENYGDPAIGKISVFVNPGWKVDLGPANSAVAGVSARTGLAKLSAGATSVDVTFANLNAYPLITLTPYGLPTGQWGITNVTDHGFTLNLSHAESFDLIFSWKAEPSGAGATMSFSDGTNAPYDPLTGASTNPPSGGSSSTGSGG